jgi:hypothetical protein
MFIKFILSTRKFTRSRRCSEHSEPSETYEHSEPSETHNNFFFLFSPLRKNRNERKRNNASINQPIWYTY